MSVHLQQHNAHHSATRQTQYFTEVNVNQGKQVTFSI